MSLGWTERLYILAFDQRGSLVKGLFGIDGDPSPAQTQAAISAKRLIFDGLLASIARGAAVANLGVLVDEQFGADVAAVAHSHGLRLAIAVEKSTRAVFEFEYGESFATHIDRFDPDFAKVLVRYNPDGDPAANRSQCERLRRLNEWVHPHGRKLLFELLVPPERSQLAALSGDRARYDAELRPALMLQAMVEIQDAGIEADVWKLEGVDDGDDAVRLATQARTGAGREDVGCVVLGRGASRVKVEHWLAQAAPVPGFVGFAIGRSIWWETITQYLADRVAHDVAVDEIATALLHFIDIYERARIGND